MEDQQPEPGGLTEDSGETQDTGDAPEDSGVPAEDTTADGATGSGSGEPAADSADGTDGADQTDPDAADTPPSPAVARSGRGRLVGLTVGVAAVLFVGAAAFAGTALHPYLLDRAAVATKLKIARSASNAITTLWTYTPDDIETLPDRAAAYLTGDLAAQYRKDIEAIEVRYKQAQISLDSQVVGVAVTSVTGDDARALVYTNTTWTSPQSKEIPGLQYRSYQVSLKRDAAHWRVTQLVPITNFSLTPQF